MKSLSEMSAAELKEQKINWYTEATTNCNINNLYLIARSMGQRLSHNYGPKYEYRDGDLVIYVDDYGGFMTVHKGGKLIVSTHNEKLYITGEWEEIIARLTPFATDQVTKRQTKGEEIERIKLLKELSL